MGGRALLALAVAVAALGAGPTAGRAQDLTFFRIASGHIGGTYFPMAAVIATAVSRPPGAIPCEEGGSCGVPGLVAIAQSSAASVENVRAVQTGEVESGLASADIVDAAFAGEGRFAATGAHDRLRAIANLFTEHLQLVLPADAELGSLAALEGRRIGIGEAGSGTRVAVEQLLELAGVSLDDVEPVELDATRSAEHLAAGELDAFFYVAGTPTAAMVQLAASPGLELYRFAADEIAMFLAAVPSFFAAEIPPGTYAGVDYAVPTVAVGAQWVTSSAQPERLIHDLTAALFRPENRQLLRRAHPKGAHIDLDSARRGVGIPLHPGAARFYAEAGGGSEEPVGVGARPR